MILKRPKEILSRFAGWKMTVFGNVSGGGGIPRCCPVVVIPVIAALRGKIMYRNPTEVPGPQRSRGATYGR